MQTRILIGSSESHKTYITNFIQEHSILPYSQIRFEGKIKIEDVQKVIRSTRVYAGTNEKRLIIFSGEITIPAQHALLKYLEELPESDSVFFLVASQEELLETIRSRCAIVSLSSENLHASDKYTDVIRPLFMSNEMSSTLFSIASCISSSQEYEELISELRQEIIKKILHERHNIPVSVISLLRYLLEQNQYVQENNVNPKLAIESYIHS